jgi:hypothetical protein
MIGVTAVALVGTCGIGVVISGTSAAGAGVGAWERGAGRAGVVRCTPFTSGAGATGVNSRFPVNEAINGDADLVSGTLVSASRQASKTDA